MWSCELNEDTACTGFIVQLPLPNRIDENIVLNAIDPVKDADGLHPCNLGELLIDGGSHRIPIPCTPRGIVALLERSGIDLEGKNVCVVGRGLTVGRPLGLLLSDRSHNATVDLCHSRTYDLASHLKRADIIVSATGKAHSITVDMLRDTQDQILVDVGISRVWNEDLGRYKILGDFTPGCGEHCAAFTPNPGGVGPMTRAMLLTNVVEMAERQLSS